MEGTLQDRASGSPVLVTAFLIPSVEQILTVFAFTGDSSCGSPHPASWTELRGPVLPLMRRGVQDAGGGRLVAHPVAPLSRLWKRRGGLFMLVLINTHTEEHR